MFTTGSSVLLFSEGFLCKEITVVKESHFAKRVCQKICDRLWDRHSMRAVSVMNFVNRLF